MVFEKAAAMAAAKPLMVEIKSPPFYEEGCWF